MTACSKAVFVAMLLLAILVTPKMAGLNGECSSRSTPIWFKMG